MSVSDNIEYKQQTKIFIIKWTNTPVSTHLELNLFYFPGKRMTLMFNLTETSQAQYRNN